MVARARRQTADEQDFLYLLPTDLIGEFLDFWSPDLRLVGETGGQRRGCAIGAKIIFRLLPCLEAKLEEWCSW
jgi:hypothetical protein